MSKKDDNNFIKSLAAAILTGSFIGIILSVIIAPLQASIIYGFAGTQLIIANSIPVFSATVSVKATIFGFFGAIVTIFSVDFRQAQKLRQEAEEIQDDAGQPLTPSHDPRKWRTALKMILSAQRIRFRTSVIFSIVLIGLGFIAVSLTWDFIGLSLFTINWTMNIDAFLRSNIFFGIGITFVILALALRSAWV